VNAKDEVMPSVSDRTIALGRLNIHYRQAGEEDLPSLIVLHGLGGKAEEWDHVSLALADQFSAQPGRILVVAPDLCALISDTRGHR
jgi:pimeloyl-ACP methyl ester carboxylesterase